MPSGVVNFYYSNTLPARSVAIAQVSVPVLTPAKLTDINNIVYEAGALGVWKATTSQSSPPDFLAPDLNVPIQISASTSCFVGNQFFELTNITAADGITPLFYQHQLPATASSVQVLDLGDNVVTAPMRLAAGNLLYHSFDGGPYRVQYVDVNGSLIQVVLSYARTMQPTEYASAVGSYTIVGSLLTLPDPGTYWFRFTQLNGYQVMPMYSYLPNTPWYPRVRFGLLPPPPEWASQTFIPYAPWLLGTYVSGTVLDTHMIQFERQNIYNDPSHLPDILIFDQSGAIKYALDGYVQTVSSTLDDPPFLKGTVYNWQRGQISSLDPTYSRVDVSVELDPTDVVWGFYAYGEPDFIYTDFDLNPVTNPMAKNTVLSMYVKYTEGTPGKFIYHQLLDSTGTPIAGQTNDPNPGLGSPVVFAQIMIGSSVSEVDFTFTDARVRGGGLSPQYQSIPQAVNFWDIGYWDGRPYPIAGAVAVYLPYTLLNSLSRSDIEGRINAAMPMGALSIVRFIDANGQEWV